MNKIYLKTKYENGIFTELLDIFKAIPNGDEFHWAILPGYDPIDIHEKALNISRNICQQISEQKFARIDWKELLVLSDGVGQFVDLVLIASQDPKKFKILKIL